MIDRPRGTVDREVGGADPIDRQFGLARSPLLDLLRTRSGLGLAPSLTPAIVFLPLGLLLGPSGFGIIASPVFQALDVVVAIGLVVLGVSAGVAFGREAPAAPRLAAAASIESLVTIGAVGAASAYFVWATGMPVEGSTAALALALGLCASASSATSADPDSEAAAGVATRVADLDDALPMVVVIAMGLLAGVQSQGVVIGLVAPLAIGGVVAAMGWLIFDRAESSGERVIFVVGVLALAAGAAAHLDVSPLTVGLCAGVAWSVVPGRIDRIVLDDVGTVQHPLVVLLLVTAGALTHPSTAALWLLAPYLLIRVAGKVAGAWTSAALIDTSPTDLAAYLMPPGVLAVAFALQFRQQLAGSTGDVVLSAVAMGTAAFELFALFVLPRWWRRPRP